jgi:hypothetical protein
MRELHDSDGPAMPAIPAIPARAIPADTRSFRHQDTAVEPNLRACGYLRVFKQPYTRVVSCFLSLVVFPQIATSKNRSHGQRGGRNNTRKYPQTRNLTGSAMRPPHTQYAREADLKNRLVPRPSTACPPLSARHAVLPPWRNRRGGAGLGMACWTGVSPPRPASTCGPSGPIGGIMGDGRHPHHQARGRAEVRQLRGSVP